MKGFALNSRNRSAKVFASTALALATALLLGSCSAAAPAENSADASAELGLVSDGQLTVAWSPFMPYISEEGGELVGLDGEIITELADRLGLEISAQQSDFAGMLSGVQNGRVDVAIGSINWTEDRTKTARFTDETYYNPAIVGGREGTSYDSVEDLEGKKVATITGYAFVEGLEKIDGVELSLFPNPESVIEEFAAGRVDVILLDGLVVPYIASMRPDLKLSTNYLKPPTDEQLAKAPELAAFLPSIVSIYVKDPSLEAALSEEVRNMVEDGTMDKFIENAGGNPDELLGLIEVNEQRRIDIDRKAGWTPPAVLRAS